MRTAFLIKAEFPWDKNYWIYFDVPQNEAMSMVVENSGTNIDEVINFYKVALTEMYASMGAHFQRQMHLINLS